jgi:hypothetical protein
MQTLAKPAIIDPTALFWNGNCPYRDTFHGRRDGKTVSFASLQIFPSAAVAQWIEYWPPKPRVVGSIPASRTTFSDFGENFPCFWGKNKTHRYTQLLQPERSCIVKKSVCNKFEKNIYIEERCGAFRFIVAVHPLPKRRFRPSKKVLRGLGDLESSCWKKKRSMSA